MPHYLSKELELLDQLSDLISMSSSDPLTLAFHRRLSDRYKWLNTKISSKYQESYLLLSEVVGIFEEEGIGWAAQYLSIVPYEWGYRVVVQILPNVDPVVVELLDNENIVFRPVESGDSVSERLARSVMATITNSSRTFLDERK